MIFLLKCSCSSTSYPFELVLGFEPSITLLCYQSMLRFNNTITWVVCSIQVQILMFINYKTLIPKLESKVLNLRPIWIACRHWMWSYNTCDHHFPIQVSSQCLTFIYIYIYLRLKGALKVSNESQFSLMPPKRSLMIYYCKGDIK